MNPDRHPTLLHNMSAPPKSVVKYEGLSALATRNLPGIGFGPGAPLAAGLLGAFYGLTAGLIWRGLRPGRALSTVASLLYVLRPPLAAQVRAAMRDPAFAAHFAR
jgi:hypothetical protein